MFGPLGFLYTERVDPVRKNKNKLSAVCLKCLYVHYQQVITWFFSCNLEEISIGKFFRPQIAKPVGRVQFCQSLKNLLVLIYSKLHEKNHVITYTNDTGTSVELNEENIVLHVRLYCGTRVICPYCTQFDRWNNTSSNVFFSSLVFLETPYHNLNLQTFVVFLLTFVPYSIARS